MKILHQVQVIPLYIILISALLVYPEGGTGEEKIDPGNHKTVGGSGDLATVKLVLLDHTTLDSIPGVACVMDKNGNSRYPPLGECFYKMVDDGYFYFDGSFQVVVPHGPTAFRISKGPEYLQKTFTVPVQGDVTLTAYLVRFLDMNELGWYSGDPHTHIRHAGGYYDLQPEDARLMAAAMGLNVVACLDNDYYFTGGVDDCSSDECLVIMSEERRTSAYGDLALLGIDSLFTPFSSKWSPLHMDVAEFAHRQEGAIVIAAHPVTSEDFHDVSGWPGVGIARELPVDCVSGCIDAMEVMSYSNFHRGGREISLWYRLLNCGIDITGVGATDATMSRLNSLPPGGFRTYVYLGEEDFTFKNWIRGIERGRVFMTNGPLISFFRLENAMPGDSLVTNMQNRSLTGGISVRYPGELIKTEIVVNGRVSHSFFFSEGSGSMDREFSLELEKSSWVAARVTGVNDRWLHVSDTLFAHTNPVYVYFGDSWRRSREDAEFLIEWIEELEQLAAGDGVWPDKTEESRLLDLCENARWFYLYRACTEVDARLASPHQAELLPAIQKSYPNPFSRSVNIELSMPLLAGISREAGRAAAVGGNKMELSIYDVGGRLVRRLFHGEADGKVLNFRWNGINRCGERVSSGVYFCTLRCGEKLQTRKIIKLE